MKLAKEWVSEHTQSGVFDEEIVKSIQQDAIQHCWNLVESHIQRGDIAGNGCDSSAQRNGVVLAANALAKELSEHAGWD